MKNFIFALTFSRILAGPLIFLLILWAEAFAVALIIFLIVAITDFWDGYLARKYNSVSEIGEILDPIADKILIVFVLFGLSVNLMSYYIAFIGAIIITREIWVGALRELNARKGRSDATKVTFLAKIKTATQLFTICIYLLGLTINNMFLILFGDMFLFLSLLITIYTGYVYTLNSLKN